MLRIKWPLHIVESGACRISTPSDGHHQFSQHRQQLPSFHHGYAAIGDPSLSLPSCVPALVMDKIRTEDEELEATLMLLRARNQLYKLSTSSLRK